MKKFTDFLTESKKTYTFKVRVAGELPEACEDRLESALKKYSVVNMTSAAKTPIVERPLDFPQLTNCEVHSWDVEVEYPVTSHQLQDYLRETCKIPTSHLIVRNPNEPQEDYQATKEDTEYEAMLGTEEMASESAQDSVGSSRVMDLLKELEVARKERDHDPIDSVQKAPEAK